MGLMDGFKPMNSHNCQHFFVILHNNIKLMQEFFKELKTALEQGIPLVFCLVTETTGSTPRKSGSKMLVFQDGSIKGTIGGGSIEHQAIQDAISMMSGNSPSKKTFHLKDDLNMQCGGTMEVYFEPIGCLPKLYIFGGGHIGKVLASFAPSLGFKTMVIDHRVGIFDNWNLPEVQTLNEDYLIAANSIVFDKNSYIVIVTPKHEFDEKVLFACAPLEYAYCGMIGSKRKVAVISQNALAQQILTKEMLEKIDMPMGVPLAAETPAEIAISIIAKLIDVKNLIKKHE